MASVSHRLSGSLQGALAGGGDPASSPLYVFGPFLRLIVVAGVAEVTFGASIWLVVFTVFMVSAMYRLVMRWVVDGSGGSGLSEEEFGPWAVKVNASITFVEYTLTFLVSIAALVTFLADRIPALNSGLGGVPFRTLIAALLSAGIGWLVNRGPRTAARAFGPATLAVLALLWAMIAATVWQRGLHLPAIDHRAFTGDYLHFTVGGFARMLALMTGIEIFANLVAAYDGTGAERSRKAFGSLMIVMGTTCLTMLIVGPAILELADPTDRSISVFTQTMDRLLPAPLPWIGTAIGVLVLASAAAASAQGLQNLALGLRYRHYIPTWLGIRNRHDVADRPVWLEVGIVIVSFLIFGTHEETYLSLYAVGVFVLLSMTGWAATKRLRRTLRSQLSLGTAATFVGAAAASMLTTAATIVIFRERFHEGAWTYLLVIPALFAVFGRFRARLGPPIALDEHLGRFFVGQYLLPFQRHELVATARLERILVPLDGSATSELALPTAETLAQRTTGTLLLAYIGDSDGRRVADPDRYLERLGRALKLRAIDSIALRLDRQDGDWIAAADRATVDAFVIALGDGSRLGRIQGHSPALEAVRRTDRPVIVLHPSDPWPTRVTTFGRLLVPLDGSESSEEALPWARRLAGLFGSSLLLLAVPETEAEVARLSDYLSNVATALRALGFPTEYRVTGTNPSRAITEVAADAACDLIVISTRGRGAPELVGVEVGSVTGRVVGSAPCPTFVVTATGFSPPVERG